MTSNPIISSARVTFASDQVGETNYYKFFVTLIFNKGGAAENLLIKKMCLQPSVFIYIYYCLEYILLGRQRIFDTFGRQENCTQVCLIHKYKKSCKQYF